MVVDEAKKGNAVGIDEIPSKVLKNDTLFFFLRVLFNVCFHSRSAPSVWSKSTINPTPKSSQSDPRDLLSYRGIILVSSMYNMYSAVLNNRLSKWAEHNNKLADEQNGIRKTRRTIDQLTSLTNIIDTRKKLKLSTFCAFIDFRKAYDYINRTKLWNRLGDIGISGKILSAVQSLHASASACIRINGM